MYIFTLIMVCIKFHLQSGHIVLKLNHLAMRQNIRDFIKVSVNRITNY